MRVLNLFSRIGVLTIVATPAICAPESWHQKHICDGMRIEVELPSGARADCMSPTHVIEIDFSSKWAEALGQALHYAAQTGLVPKVALICRQRPETCAGHEARLRGTISHWRLPVEMETIVAADRDR